eukprot:scaffold2668_cov319-Prasinococcus_capsulatus_cf.AAC.16
MSGAVLQTPRLHEPAEDVTGAADGGPILFVVGFGVATAEEGWHRGHERAAEPRRVPPFLVCHHIHLHL